MIDEVAALPDDRTTDPDCDHPTADDDLKGLLNLCNPMFPARRLPTRLRLLLPEPFTTVEHYRRFKHEDIAELSPAERRWEALRLKTAAASLEYDQVPPWIFARLKALAA